MQKKSPKKPANLDPRQFEGDPRAEMSRMYDKTFKNFTESSIVPGRIIEVRENDVVVDIGYKSEALISKNEFRGPEPLVLGQEFEVLIENMEDEEGMLVLSREHAIQQRKWEHVVNHCAEGSIIQGEIRARVKGGMIVDIGVEAFLPGSQLDLTPTRDPDALVGQTLDFKIIKINKERRNVVLSRREMLEDQRREHKRQLLGEIKPGQVRTGVVKNLTDFGAFIDLNGMDGLLHITDISWGRLNHPSEALAVGQQVEVVVLDVDLEKERISLGRKQLTPNPWEGIEHRYPVGSRIKGKVVNLVAYGAFIEIEEGIEGLVHVSELSWTKRVAKASDVLNAGDEVEAVVLSVSGAEQKLSLGIRQTEANPWDEVQEKYAIGARVKGTVRNFTTYGAFVELEAGVDGMIHVSDMSWTRKVNHPSEVLKKGDEVECLVLEVDSANQRISLGLKQVQEDPWTALAAKYSIGQRVTGKVSKIASFGAFIDLGDGIDGLVHISQISEERIQKVRDVLQPGQEIEARVIKVDPADRKIGLSIKAAKMADEEFKVSEDMLQGLRPGEDLVDLAGAFDEAFGPGAEWSPGETK
jgi:small subunit ribosomal protein S1